MNGVKGKFLKKFKSIKPISHINQDRILQALALDGFTDYFSRNENPEVHMKKTAEKIHEDKEQESSDENDNKENIGPPNHFNGIIKSRNGFENCKSFRAPNDSDELRQPETDTSSFRRPDMNSGSLFDPELLAVFRQAVMEHMKVKESETQCTIEVKNEEEERENQENPLFGFPENCPPGGSETVILYTTTLRGIRKTFEDCNSVRFLLETFRVKISERDISMHRDFREELWRVLKSKSSPPKLFIKGRFIGGAEEVLRLHEQGKLKPLLAGAPIDRFAGTPCEGCGGIRFVLCSNCNGSRKVNGENYQWSKCAECNENGLILCSYCW